MTPLESAISICGSQAELARRIGGNVRTGHIYFWLRNAVPEESCPQIEAATEGAVTCEVLRPDRKWNRDAAGTVTGYTVKVATPEVRDDAADAQEQRP